MKKKIYIYMNYFITKMKDNAKISGFDKPGD